MKACPAREEALNLLKKYNSEPFHIQHIQCFLIVTAAYKVGSSTQM